MDTAARVYAIYVPSEVQRDDLFGVGVVLCDRPERFRHPKRGPEVDRIWLSTGASYHEDDGEDAGEDGLHLVGLDNTYGYYQSDNTPMRNLGILLRYGTDWYDSSVDRLIVRLKLADIQERVLDLYARGQTEVALAGGTLYVAALPEGS